MVTVGKLVREFKQAHTSHIFDVKFDITRIVRYVLNFSRGVFGVDSKRLVLRMTRKSSYSTFPRISTLPSLSDYFLAVSARWR